MLTSTFVIHCILLTFLLNQLIDYWKERSCFNPEVVKGWLNMALEKQKKISIRNEQRKIANDIGDVEQLHPQISNISYFDFNRVNDSSSRNKTGSNITSDISSHHIDSQRLATSKMTQEGSISQHSARHQSTLRCDGGSIVNNSSNDSKIKNQSLSSSREKQRGLSPTKVTSSVSSLEIHRYSTSTTPSSATTQESIESRRYSSLSANVLDRNGVSSIFFDAGDLEKYSSSFFIDQLATSLKAPRRVEMVAHHLLHQLTNEKKMSFRYEFNHMD